MTGIEVEVEYSESDFVRGMVYCSQHGPDHKLMRTLFLVFSILVSISTYAFLFRSEGPINSSDLMAMGLLLLIGGPIIYLMKDYSFYNERAFSKIYTTTPLVRESYRININENGITSHSDSFDSEMKWNAFRQITESSEDFFFFTGPRQALFIPKRVFTGDQLDILRSLTHKFESDIPAKLTV